MKIVAEGLTHIYNEGTPFEAVALRDVNLEIKDGELVGIIGHTGCGKTTLIQHFNGLLKATRGRVLIDGVDISKKGADIKSLRQRVGLVFQYPEYQIFEETVYDEVAFGPRNMGIDPDGVRERVRSALAFVDLNYEELKDKSPFWLSGGEKRRLAIASVLAMRPEVLILDEPSAGLDPAGREEILGQILRLNKKEGTTVVLVSHNMKEIARLAERLFVMSEGTVVLEGTPREIFQRADLLKGIGLGVPQVVELVHYLRERGIDFPQGVITVSEARDAILSLFKGSGVKSRCSGISR